MTNLERMQERDTQLGDACGACTNDAALGPCLACICERDRRWLLARLASLEAVVKNYEADHEQRLMLESEGTLTCGCPLCVEADAALAALDAPEEDTTT